ncbi:hypothetical protein H310_15053, partial [Aphanomyces invadans]
RKPNVPVLCFMGIDGLLETFVSDGTFDQHQFTSCVRSFTTSSSCNQYPGINLIWIMDGAKIHCCDKIIYYLRSL